MAKAVQQDLPMKSARVTHIRCTPNMKRIVDKAIALRTSALCRDDDGKLILPEEIESSELAECDSIDDESVALVAIISEWLKRFTKEQLAELRNGHDG